MSLINIANYNPRICIKITKYMHIKWSKGECLINKLKIKHVNTCWKAIKKY